MDIKNLADNPYLNTASNTSNFEFRTLYKYLIDGKEENPLEFFREYVRNKGHYYHGSMEEFLMSLNLDDVIIDSDTPEKIETAKAMLKKAIKYEGTAKEILTNPTDDVLRTELGKIQVRTFLNSDQLGSKIQNSKKIQSAYNQLVSILEKNIASSDGKQKEYYTETLKSLRDKFKGFVFEPGQVDIPDDENLIKRVFGEIKTIVKPEDKIDDVIDTVKNSNKKLYAIVAVGIALLGIGGALLYKKNKMKNLKVKQTPNIQNSAPNKPQKTVYNTLLNKTSNVFAEFQ